MISLFALLGTISLCASFFNNISEHPCNYLFSFEITAQIHSFIVKYTQIGNMIFFALKATNFFLDLMYAFTVG